MSSRSGMKMTPATPDSFLRRGSPARPRRRLSAGLAVMLLGTVAAQGLDANLPFPYPQPHPVESVFGDPALSPTPDAHTTWDEAWIQATVNQGNPFTDYGHWRLDNIVYQPPWVIGREGDGPTQWTSSERNAWNALWGAPIDWRDGSLLSYNLLPPPAEAEEPAEGWPLVVINPGSGALGRSSGAVTHWASTYHREHFPGYVVTFNPQARPMDYLPDGNAFILPVFHEQFEVLDALMADAALNINPNRVYASGFSMGGSTTWLMALHRPHFFAAVAPVSSRPLTSHEQAEWLRHLPIWMTTGHDDGGSGSSQYLQAYQWLRAAGAESVRFWEVQFTGHASNVERSFFLPAWMFSQERTPAPDPIARASLTHSDGLTIAFSSDGSGDPEGGDVQVDWDFGDGHTSTASAGHHTYAETGAHTLRLRVWSDANRLTTVYRTVIVDGDSLTINAPPRSNGISAHTPFNTPVALSRADFEAVFSDEDGDPLAAVRFDTAPILGQLLLDGEPVARGQVIPVEELDGLVYLPTGNTGVERIDFNVFDGYSWSPYVNPLSLPYPPNRSDVLGGAFNGLRWTPHITPRLSVSIGEPPPSTLFADLWTASSATMETSTITVGSQYFVDDEGPVLTELPDYLEGAENIRTTSTRTTTNGVQDSNQSGAGTWIRFEVTRDATIYVAYDGRNSAVPAWLDDWEFVSGDEVKSWIHYDLFKKEFPAGSIVELGTNRAPPGDGPNGYFVMGQASSPDNGGGDDGPPAEPPNPQPSVVRTGDGAFLLRWEGDPDMTYVLRSSDALGDPALWPVVTEIPGREGAMEHAPAMPGAGPRFWVLEVFPR